MRKEEAGSVQKTFKKQVGEICQHFTGLQPWISDISNRVLANMMHAEA